MHQQLGAARRRTKALQQPMDRRMSCVNAACTLRPTPYDLQRVRGFDCLRHQWRLCLGRACARTRSVYAPLQRIGMVTREEQDHYNTPNHGTNMHVAELQSMIHAGAISERLLRKWTLQTINSSNTIVCDLGLESHHAVDVIGLHGLVWF